MKLISMLLCLSASLAAVAAPSIAAPPWAAERGRVSMRDLAATTVPSAPAALTLQQALQLGFANSSGFRSVIAELLSAQGQYEVARQLYELDLSGSTRTTHTVSGERTRQSAVALTLRYEALTGATFSLSAALDRLADDETRTVGLSVAQPLLRGAGTASTRYESLRRARNAYRTALLRYYLRRQDLALDIITGYFGVVLARQQVAIQEQGLQQSDLAVKDAQARFAEGIGIKIEITRAQLSQASRSLALNGARLDYLDSMDRFLQHLGLQVGATPDLATQPVYSPIAVDVESAVSRALTDRAEIRIEDLGLEDAQASLRISRNRSRPSLDLFGSTTHIGDGGDTGSDWMLGIQTSIPINSRSLKEAVREAGRAWLLALREKSELRQSVTTEVRRTVHTLQSQQARVEILNQTLEAAREKLSLANISIEEGIGVYRDKIEAQDEVTSAEQDLLDAQISYYFDVLTLRRVTGRDVLAGIEQETRAAAPQEPQK